MGKWLFGLSQKGIFFPAKRSHLHYLLYLHTSSQKNQIYEGAW